LGDFAERETSDAMSAESSGLYDPDMVRCVSWAGIGISEFVGRGVGFRTSRMFNFWGMYLCELLFFLRQSAVEEKDRRTTRGLAR
jgi:hypothetical protein